MTETDTSPSSAPIQDKPNTRSRARKTSAHATPPESERTAAEPSHPQDMTAGSSTTTGKTLPRIKINLKSTERPGPEPSESHQLPAPEKQAEASGGARIQDMTPRREVDDGDEADMLDSGEEEEAAKETPGLHSINILCFVQGDGRCNPFKATNRVGAQETLYITGEETRKVFLDLVAERARKELVDDLKSWDLTVTASGRGHSSTIDTRLDSTSRYVELTYVRWIDTAKLGNEGDEVARPKCKEKSLQFPACWPVAPTSHHLNLTVANTFAWAVALVDKKKDVSPKQVPCEPPYVEEGYLLGAKGKAAKGKRKSTTSVKADPSTSPDKKAKTYVSTPAGLAAHATASAIHFHASQSSDDGIEFLGLRPSHGLLNAYTEARKKGKLIKEESAGPALDHANTSSVAQRHLLNRLSEKIKMALSCYLGEDCGPSEVDEMDRNDFEEAGLTNKQRLQVRAALMR
ncbi:hypothetical protein V8E36_003838 [Tilletia maclaganii]